MDSKAHCPLLEIPSAFAAAELLPRPTTFHVLRLEFRSLFLPFLFDLRSDRSFGFRSKQEFGFSRNVHWTECEHKG
jgi:hypothetical protein